MVDVIHRVPMIKIRKLRKIVEKQRPLLVSVRCLCKLFDIDIR